MAGAHVDMNGALAMAQALGVPPATAASLIAACASGLAIGAAERKKKEAEAGDEQEAP